MAINVAHITKTKLRFGNNECHRNSGDVELRLQQRRQDQ